MVENTFLYGYVEAQRAALEPLRNMTQFAKEWSTYPFNPLSHTDIGKSFGAACQLLERITRHYPKPTFDISETEINGKAVKIQEKIVLTKTFCQLLHFKKTAKIKQPQLLIVAPLSGHYATLLRGTVQGLLPYYDVYITDWFNANTIPAIEGRFDLDDHIDYMIGFMEKLGKNGPLHVIAVCQPSVPVLAAVSIMSEQKSKTLPKTMTLIGGPIDTRHSPTEVNELATEKSMMWFSTNMITRVPFGYEGFMRRVYPGFLQLAGFMSMNLNRHIEEHMRLFSHLIEGDGDSVTAHKKFYNEYLAVMDIPAEFYLQTIDTVFKTHALPEGTMMSRDRKVDPAQIRATRLLAIEGGKDDISGIGQTKAAIKLCKNIPADGKQYHLQKDVGHYGLFNGRKFRESIVPVIRKFIEKS